MNSVKRNNRSHDIRLSDKTMHVVHSGNFMLCPIPWNSIREWWTPFCQLKLFFLLILWTENSAKWIQDWNLKSLAIEMLHSGLLWEWMRWHSFNSYYFDSSVMYIVRHEIVMFIALIVMSYLNEFEWNVNEKCSFFNGNM